VDDPALVAEPSHGQVQGVAQMLQRGATVVAQLDPLQVVPDALVRIQVRRIPWQDLEVEAGGSAIGQEVLDRLAGVDRPPSQITSSWPGMWRSRCCRKRTTSGLWSGCSWTSRNKRSSRVMPLLTDRWSRVKGTCKMGVWARGA